MIVKIIKECGFSESAIGFSLSYNSTPERAKEILYKYAFKNNGENKFLRSIQVWLDITAPRFVLTELDTYKISTVRLSSSTIHTLSKRLLSQEDFEYSITPSTLDNINEKIRQFNNKEISLAEMKNELPEGFLQRIILNCNYANLQNMYLQRKNHKLPQWHIFIDTILSQIEHPEFIVPPLEEK
jgi:hypothetical protein